MHLELYIVLRLADKRQNLRTKTIEVNLNFSVDGKSLENSRYRDKKQIHI